MNPFFSTLKTINDRLDLPQPQKSRILLEIAGDLNDLYRLYLDQGLSKEEAKQKTELKFDLNEYTLNELIKIHNTGFRKLFCRFSEQAQTRWEQVGVLLILVSIFIAFSASFLSTDFFNNSSFFLRPLFLIAILTILLFLHKFYQFYIKKDHTIVKLRSGLHSILILGIFSLFFSVFAYLIDLYALGSMAVSFAMNPFLMILLKLDTPVELDIVEKVSNWYLSSSSLIMTGIVIAILAALFWYILHNKVTKIEIAESSFLMEE
jgi:hypothetical protein